jgi:hypothetical protein
MSMSLKVEIRSEAVRHMTESAISLSILAVRECALRYGFSAEEALVGLNLSSVEAVEVSEKKSRKARGSSRVDVEKPKVVRSAFPLPYNGEMNESCCFGLRLCEGLYTQCRVARKGESSFCKVCEEVALLNNGVPTYGTIQERKACYDSNVEFKDPKGKSPVAYSRVMRKHKLSESQVVEEAGKLNMIINPVHFTAVEGETKRGRPKAANKAPKEPKGAKGRPKKSKKVLEIDGGEDDLFATLMAEANNESTGSDVSSIASEVEAEAEVEIAIKPKEPKKKAKDAAKEAEKEAEKALKAQEKEAEKLKKEQEKEAEKKLKEQEKATKAAEKASKAAEKLAKEAEKATKAAEKEAAKALKEAEKKQKETAKSAKSAPAAAVTDNEPDVVKRFEFEGKKYLKSKKTGIIYNMEQDVIGKWNDVTNKIDFTSTDEEVEEEYEEEEDEVDEE